MLWGILVISSYVTETENLLFLQFMVAACLGL